MGEQPWTGNGVRRRLESGEPGSRRGRGPEQESQSAKSNGVRERIQRHTPSRLPFVFLRHTTEKSSGKPLPRQNRT